MCAGRKHGRLAVTATHEQQCQATCSPLSLSSTFTQLCENTVSPIQESHLSHTRLTNENPPSSHVQNESSPLNLCKTNANQAQVTSNYVSNKYCTASFSSACHVEQNNTNVNHSSISSGFDTNSALLTTPLPKTKPASMQPLAPYLALSMDGRCASGIEGMLAAHMVSLACGVGSLGGGTALSQVCTES